METVQAVLHAIGADSVPRAIAELHAVDRADLAKRVSRLSKARDAIARPDLGLRLVVEDCLPARGPPPSQPESLRGRLRSGGVAQV